MPAGFKYDLKPIEKTMPELCRFETVYRLSGGFNLDTTNLTGIDKIPPMTPLVIDFKTRTAKTVVNVEVYEKYTTGTSMKIKKGSLAYVNMFIGDGTNGAKVTKIDKSNAEYDTITLGAAFGTSVTVNAGTVLFEASAQEGTEVKASANALNYAWTKVEAGVTVTAIGRAYEIRTSKLLVPVSDKDKESLGDRFMFTY